MLSDDLNDTKIYSVRSGTTTTSDIVRQEPPPNFLLLTSKSTNASP